MCDNVIQTGLNVLIKRNDGRTHHAIISNVNGATRFVAVEWFEGGETKGKEVEFDALFALNPNLAVDRPKETLPAIKRREVEENKKPSILSRSRSAVEKSNCPIQNIDAGFARISKSKLSRTFSSKSLDKLPAKIRTHSMKLKKKQAINFEIDADVVERRGESVSSVAIGIPMGLPPLKSKPKRKSCTVKEVEKLQKNRMLRRMKQAKIKDEREALMTINSGNPNWQFQAMIREYQGRLEFKPLTGADEADSEHFQITVCVRKRPLNRRENLNKEVDVVSIPRKNIVVVHEPKNKVDLTKYLENQQFKFDYTFDEMCSNETVYNFTARPLVQTIFDGGTATCFAYGQTGSGKTHTMSGAPTGPANEKGIYAMVAIDVFKYLQYSEHREKNLTVSSSYYEIYGGKVYDLLAKKARLRVLEDGKQHVQVVGLTEKITRSVDEVLFLIECGNNARTSGRTAANATSSRSHAIFQLTLRQGSAQKIYGRIHLVDLAGNERGADTSSSSRITRLEGSEINKSLLALKECIRALGRKGSYLPFRGSTLTLVLRDSFIGDKTKTCMIAMISPGMSSCEHSLNTLRYADRVKELAGTETLVEAAIEDKPHRIENWPTALCNSSDSETVEASRPVAPGTSTTTSGKSNKMQDLEQQMLNALQLWIQLCPKFDKKEAQMLAQFHKLAHDPRKFSFDLERLLGERHKFFLSLRDCLTAFRLQIDSEEESNNKENHKLSAFNRE